MRGRSEGFTLVELLLTLAVLAIGLTSIFSLLPGVTAFSRELRDKHRMETFASAVFDALEGSIAQEQGGVILSDEERHEFPSLIGDQRFKISSTEERWPDTGAVQDLVPVLFYTIEVQTNSVVEVEVKLTLRPETSAVSTEFTRLLYPQVKAW